MEKLQEMSQSELQELLDNTERVESMALESDEIQNIQLEREMALASNRSLAEQNLDVKPRLEQQKELLVERYSQLEAAHDAYRQRRALRDGMAGQVSPEALFSRLQAEGASTEAESETLAAAFLDGSVSLEVFLDRFLSQRCLAHRRRVRVEKFQDFLRQRTPAPGATPGPAPAGPPPTGREPAVAPGDPHPQQPSSSPAGGSSYAPYPVSPAVNPPPSSSDAPARFSPYPPGPRPAFGPVGPGCPYPSRPSFPGPHPGSAFGQYTPGPAPYPASYSYGGYSYPAGPPYPGPQPQAARPMYRPPGYGVSQPYS